MLLNFKSMHSYIILKFFFGKIKKTSIPDRYKNQSYFTSCYKQYNREHNYLWESKNNNFIHFTYNYDSKIIIHNIIFSNNKNNKKLYYKW